jgi:hypothetical protein
MSNQDFDALKKEFDDFSLRLDARTHEFRDSGSFSTTHASVAERLQKGHAAIEAKLAAAIHGGAVWEASKVELERDINAVIEDLVHLEKLFDAQTVKR